MGLIQQIRATLHTHNRNLNNAKRKYEKNIDLAKKRPDNNRRKKYSKISNGVIRLLSDAEDMFDLSYGSRASSNPSHQDLGPVAPPPPPIPPRPFRGP